MGERNNDFSFLNGLFGTPEPTTPKPYDYLTDLAAAYKPQDTPLSILAGLTLSGSMFAPTPKPSGIYFDRFGADSVHFSEPCKFPWYFTPLAVPAVYAILVANPFSPNGFRVVYFGQTGDAETRPTKSHEHYDDWCRVGNGAENLFVAYHWMFGSTEEERTTVERSLVAYHHPEVNTTYRTATWISRALKAASTPALTEQEALSAAIIRMLGSNK
jgi:hypothetical protein